MDARGSIYFLVATLIALSASASRAEEQKPNRTAAEKLQVLQTQISDPEDFKSFVEGSLRIPEGTAVPRTQSWPQAAGQALGGAPIRTAGQAAIKSALLSPTFPGHRITRQAELPPVPAYVDRTPMAVADNLPKYPLKAFGLVSLFAVGLFALAGKSEFASAPEAPFVLESVRPAPAELPMPQAPLTDTPAVRTLLTKLETPIEPYIDTRMPVSSWRAISMREQQLLEIWDASYEKAMGQPFAEWLDAQGSLEGSFADVDTALLKTKLDRDA